MIFNDFFPEKNTSHSKLPQTTASMSSKTSDTSPKADDPEEIQVVPTKNKMETVVEFHAPEVKTNESNSKIKAVVDFHAGEEKANESNSKVNAKEEKANEFELQPLTTDNSENV